MCIRSYPPMLLFSPFLGYFRFRWAVFRDYFLTFRNSVVSLPWTLVICRSKIDGKVSFEQSSGELFEVRGVPEVLYVRGTFTHSRITRKRAWSADGSARVEKTASLTFLVLAWRVGNGTSPPPSLSLSPRQSHLLCVLSSILALCGTRSHSALLRAEKLSLLRWTKKYVIW